jgi:outer membrane lipoprotein-sorting protein
MSKRIILLALSLAIAMTASLPASDDAIGILRRSDRFRPSFDSFVVRVKLTNSDAGETVDEADFEVSIKGDNSLVKFLSTRSKGQSLLMRGDDMWMFLPSVARPVRITPIQRLMGNVSNGDLARLRYADDYTATLEGQVQVEGQTCDVLDLRARRKSATYQRVRYIVRRSDARPLNAEYSLTSGKVMKRATFTAPRDMAGRQILSRTIIADADNPDSVTTIDLLSVAPKPLADKVFSVARSDG